MVTLVGDGGGGGGGGGRRRRGFRETGWSVHGFSQRLDTTVNCCPFNRKPCGLCAATVPLSTYYCPILEHPPTHPHALSPQRELGSLHTMCTLATMAEYFLYEFLADFLRGKPGVFILLWGLRRCPYMTETPIPLALKNNDWER